MITTIIFDWKQTLYSPGQAGLIEGTKEVLDFLGSKDVDVYLVGKGGEDMHAEIDRLGVRTHFKDVLFVGTDKRTEHFEQFIVAEDHSEVLIIGDKLSSEIELGNMLGARTIQVKQGKFAGDEPVNSAQKPDMVVINLAELKNILEKLL